METKSNAMKKQFILTLVIGGLTFTSCKKCKECTITTVQNVNGFNQSSSTTSEYCGDNYDDAPADGTVNQEVGSIQQTVTTTCKDK